MDTDLPIAPLRSADTVYLDILKECCPDVQSPELLLEAHSYNDDMWLYKSNNTHLLLVQFDSHTTAVLKIFSPKNIAAILEQFTHTGIFQQSLWVKVISLENEYIDASELPAKWSVNWLEVVLSKLRSVMKKIYKSKGWEYCSACDNFHGPGAVF